MSARTLIAIALCVGIFEMFCCTIGIANGTATSDGRPLMWKSRDTSDHQQVVRYYGDGEIQFVGVATSATNGVWMGVNVKGFAIGNAVAYDLERLMGNGDLMTYCLPRCVTLEDFEAILDSTDIVGRATYGSFAVFDSTGAAAMYEVDQAQYWKFDTVDTPNGYIVRTNFTVNGGGTHSAIEYARSKTIIGDLYDENNLNYRSIIQTHSRDFADQYGNPFEIPFRDYYDIGMPWGYIFTHYSICERFTQSVGVFRGILPGESPKLSVMWLLPGHPETSIAIPIFPVGLPPVETNLNDLSYLYLRANLLRSMICDYWGSLTHIDTYRLRNSAGTGIWDKIYPMETYYFDRFDYCFQNWLNEMPGDNEILDMQYSMATDAYEFLMNLTVETEMEPYFEVDNLEPHPTEYVQFTERSLHGPAYWKWDFDNDGVYDSQEQNPSWLYGEEGVYSVKLTVYDGEDSASFVREDYIHVLNHPPDFPYYEPHELEFEVVEDETIAFSIEVADEDQDSLFIQWYWNSMTFVDSLELVTIRFDQLGDQTLSCEVTDPYSQTRLDWLIHVVPMTEENPAVPEYTWSLSNFPNPFNPSTTVSFSLKRDSEVRLDIYDVRGRKVRTLTDERYTAGQHQIVWDGISDDDKEMASGVYLLKLTTGEANLLRKALMVK